ncbi:hypothetical protein GJ744_005919 [Endocarpon pusillum]|uniref:Tryptophan synthase beta chain-like PALP domain-containing protein n=1 Tax=Endocarpon pusillum TaxID=364733 RepID=A0A8H7E536_9EURO|nr:hypothetical protein GJ744_005919 [Endocarpon pusillum]
MRLLFERAKWVVEPSGAVGLAVVLFNQDFRRWVEREQRKEAEMGGGEDDGEIIRPWNIGVVISGGNTTLDAIASLFGPGQGEGGGGGGGIWEMKEKEKGKVGNDDKKEQEVGNAFDNEKSESGLERERHEGKITMDREKAVEDVAG